MQTGKEVILPWYGCKGMRDVEYGNRDPEYASWLQNLFPVDPVNGGPLVGRPSFAAMTGVPSSGAIQLLYEYEQSGGTKLVVGIFAGEIYTANTGAWTRVVTSANLATAGVTLSTTAKVYAATYTGLMVLSDGVNKPFTWDGTTGAGGLALISNASGAWYGAPFVYYAKLGGIQAADRTTFEWSEENTPNTGYEAGGYTNAWTLTQTSSRPLSRMLGTNNALYYWRTRGAGMILGAMNADFQTAGVHDAISTEVGTNFPNGFVLVGSTMFFLDQFYRPWALPIGGGPLPIWQDIARQFVALGGGQTAPKPWTLLHTTSTVYSAANSWEARVFFGAIGTGVTAHTASAVYIAFLDQVVFFLRVSPGASVHHDYTVGVAYSPTTLRALGYWVIPWGCTEVLASATSGDGTNSFFPFTMYAGGLPTKAATAPAVGYTSAKQGTIDAAGFTNDLGAAEYRVIGPRLGWDVRKRYDFREIDWAVRQRSTSTEYSYSSQYFTSEAPTTADIATAQTLSRPTANVHEHKTTFGVGGLGRWLAPMVTVSPGTTDTTVLPMVHGCSVLARPIAPEGAAS